MSQGDRIIALCFHCFMEADLPFWNGRMVRGELVEETQLRYRHQWPAWSFDQPKVADDILLTVSSQMDGAKTSATCRKKLANMA